MKKRILEVLNFSAGGCGVFARAKEEAKLLSKRGNEVLIVTSNRIKGCDGIAAKKDRIGNVNIIRLPAIKLGGESFMKWDFEHIALEFKPDVIITHGYRHLHTLKALKIAKKIGSRVILVTHAPFNRDSTRTLIEKIIVWLYDKTIGKATINKFDKIVAITKWEIPELIKIGARREKIVYIPNGIRNEFLQNIKKNKNRNHMVYIGRISPIKNLDVLISAVSIIKKNIKLTIMGPAEKPYLKNLLMLCKNSTIGKKVRIIDKHYNSEEQIGLLDKSGIYVLPSKSEGMPQTLIEAMARGKIVIASKIPACSEIIKDEKNGYLFDYNSSEDLAKTIERAISKKNNVEKNAIKSVREFDWDIIIKKIEAII